MKTRGDETRGLRTFHSGLSGIIKSMRTSNFFVFLIIQLQLLLCVNWTPVEGVPATSIHLPLAISSSSSSLSTATASSITTRFTNQFVHLVKNTVKSIDLSQISSMSTRQIANMLQQARQYLLPSNGGGNQQERRALSRALRILNDLVVDNGCEILEGNHVHMSCGRRLLFKGAGWTRAEYAVNVTGLSIAWLVALVGQFMLMTRDYRQSVKFIAGLIGSLARTLIFYGIMYPKLTMDRPNFVRYETPEQRAFMGTLIYSLLDLALFTVVPLALPGERADYAVNMVSRRRRRHRRHQDDGPIFPIEEFCRQYFREPEHNDQTPKASHDDQPTETPEEPDVCLICQEVVLCPWNVSPGTEVPAESRMFWFNSCKHGGHPACFYEWYQRKAKEYWRRQRNEPQVVTDENGVELHLDEDGNTYVQESFDSPGNIDVENRDAGPQATGESVEEAADVEWPCPACKKVVAVKQEIRDEGESSDAVVENETIREHSYRPVARHSNGETSSDAVADTPAAREHNYEQPNTRPNESFEVELTSSRNLL